MKYGNKKLFIDKPKLSQMLTLRYQGYALTSLALLFNCDRTSVAYQCDKFHIKPAEDTYTIERLISQVLPKQQEIRRNVTLW